MKKYILCAVLILFTASPSESAAKKKEQEFINPISPEKVERILDTASKEAKKNAPEIKELVREYMKSIKKFGNEMAELFSDVL